MEKQGTLIKFPIGKHKGEPISKVIEDTNYCDWLSRQEWFSKKFPELQRMMAMGRPKVILRSRKRVTHKPVMYIKSNPEGICLN